MNAVKKYIEAHGTTPFAVALKVGFSPSTVCRHVRDERGISAESAMIYYRELGIPLEELRPDLFTSTLPPPPAQSQDGAA